MRLLLDLTATSWVFYLASLAMMLLYGFTLGSRIATWQDDALTDDFEGPGTIMEHVPGLGCPWFFIRRMAGSRTATALLGLGALVVWIAAWPFSFTFHDVTLRTDLTAPLVFMFLLLFEPSFWALVGCLIAGLLIGSAFLQKFDPRR